MLPTVVNLFQYGAVMHHDKMPHTTIVLHSEKDDLFAPQQSSHNTRPTNHEAQCGYSTVQHSTAQFA